MTEMNFKLKTIMHTDQWNTAVQLHCTNLLLY